jgi:hypothetical protein
LADNFVSRQQDWVGRRVETLKVNDQTVEKIASLQKLLNSAESGTRVDRFDEGVFF